MTLKTVDSQDVARPTGDWLRLSREFTWLTQRLGDRLDITVAVAPGAGWGAPAAFLFPAASIEMDSEYWPENFKPGQASPEDIRDWKNYGAFLGMLCHETAHANHSGWMYELGKTVELGIRKFTDDEKHAAGACKLLEEIRIEHKHLLARSQDAQWLTTFAVTISTAEAFKAKEITSLAHASRCALLVLGRIDAGDMIDNDDTRRVQQLIENQIGAGLLTELRNIWVQFLKCDDDATEEMLELGRRWYELTKDDPDEKPDDGGAIGQELADALDDLADAIAQEMDNADGLKEMLEKLGEAIRESDKEMEARFKARSDARNVFHGHSAGMPAGTYHAFQGWRDPTLDERSLARRTAQEILEAYMREKTLMPHMAVLPPGRLNARQAMTRQAQKAQGMYPTATPFKTVKRKANPSPPLDVGIVVDTSYSQSAAVTASAKGAYALAQAVKIIPDGRVAMATFGDMALKILGPYDQLKGVPVLKDGGGTGHFRQAVRSIDGEMNFLRKGAARLLVVVTDGYLNPPEFEGRDDILKRLLKNGAHILWVHTGAPGGDSSAIGPNARYADHWVIPDIKHPFYRAVQMTDPADVPRLICEEAVKVLEQT